MQPESFCCGLFNSPIVVRQCIVQEEMEVAQDQGRRDGNRWQEQLEDARQDFEAIVQVYYTETSAAAPIKTHSWFWILGRDAVSNMPQCIPDACATGYMLVRGALELQCV